ncbi:ABC transporter substrate-binding protein [Yersinia enterocolitica]
MPGRIVSRFLSLVAMCLVITSSFSVLAQPIVVTDIAGRQVTLAEPASRVILADARALMALNILHPQTPLKGIIAWDNSLKVKAADLVEAYAKKFPEVNKIPMFDNPYVTDFSVERAVSMQPDLIIFDTGLLAKLKASGVLAQLDKSGIPVLFIDFRQQPLTNTVPSMQLLGKVFNEEKNAEDFIQFYQQRLALVRQRVATLKPEQRPSVFIERHAGMTGNECCSTFGKGSFGQFIAEAGGNNVGSQLFPEMGGEINVEQLISSNPDFYLMTGADWSRGHKGSVAVPLGYNTDTATTQEKLTHLMGRTGISILKSVQDKKVMAVYHQFYDSPLNVVAVEAIAKFLHPELFADLDPQADLEMIHQKYTAIDYSGVFWVTALRP